MNHIKLISLLICLFFSACDSIDDHDAETISDFRAKCILDNAKFFVYKFDDARSDHHVCQYETYHHILRIESSQIHYIEGEFK